MPLDYNDLPEIFFQASIFFIIYILLYKKYIYSIFDPLFIYSFTMAFSSVLVISTLLETEPTYAIHFFVCNIFLFIGFYITTYKLQSDKRPLQSLPEPFLFADYATFKIVVYILCMVFFSSNILMFYTTGFAILTDDPTVSRLENIEKGIAILYNINYAVGGFVIAGLLFMILSKFSYVDLFLLIAISMLTALDGKKSVLLRVMVIFAMMVKHRLFSRNRKIASRVKLVIPLGVISILVVFFVIVFKENTANSDEAILKSVQRLLYGADSTLFFYLPVNVQYFAKFHFWDYPGHLFNQILGLLRLVSFEQSHGDAMVRNIFTQDTGVVSGPNTPYYIEGQIYFGYYGAFIYSAVVGASYALIRRYFFSTQFHSAFGVVLICCVSAQASDALIEVTLAITKIFEIFFFVLPIYVVINFAIHGSIKWKKIYFRKLYSKG